MCVCARMLCVPLCVCVCVCMCLCVCVCVCVCTNVCMNVCEWMQVGSMFAVMLDMLLSLGRYYFYHSGT